MSRTFGLPERLLVLWVLVALFFVSCADQPTTTGATTTATARCSASDEPIPPAQGELPEPVATMRTEILTAAVACDFDRLNQLAVAGDVSFVHTDVLVDEYQNMTPGEFWQNAEAQGAEILALLVHDLSQPFEIEQYKTLGVVYVWRDPAACGTLEELLLCRWVEITEAGDWIAFYTESP